MWGIEPPVIDENTHLRDFKNVLRWNDAGIFSSRD
jgi:L-arabinose isomerase